MTKMLKYEDGKPESALWKLSGVLVVKTAIAIGVPILANYE